MDITEVAQHTGLTASTLRFYEEKELIASIGRRGLHRVFDPRVLERLALIARWVAPPASRSMRSRPYTVIAEPVSLTQDFTRLKSLSRDDQQKQLRELAARGEVMTATYAARQLYGGSLAEAKQTVNSLLSDQVPQQRF